VYILNVLISAFMKFIDIWKKGIFFLVLLPASVIASSHTSENESINTFKTADLINLSSENTGSMQNPSDKDYDLIAVLPTDGTLKVIVTSTNTGSKISYPALYCYDRTRNSVICLLCRKC
jgi:hypothetical protein